LCRRLVVRATDNAGAYVNGNAVQVSAEDHGADLGGSLRQRTSYLTVLKMVGSDEHRGHGGGLVPNHTETVASSVLHQDIAGRKHYLRAIVNLDR
jgi:hypothetical protein